MAELDLPLACMMERSRLPPNVQVLEAGSAAAVADAVRREGCRWVWVEGFCGAGKSSFAGKLADQLDWRPVDADNLLDDSTRDDRFASGIDRAQLHQFLGTPALRSNVVFSGLCLRDVVALLGTVEPAFVVYIARVSNPSPDSFIWQDGFDMEAPSAVDNWMVRDSMRYHAESHPYRDARFIFLRVDNENVPMC
jgi:hypothetical protein